MKHIELMSETRRLSRLFKLKVFGIKEKREGIEMSSAYLKKLREGSIEEFPTGRIITMDDPDYRTIEFGRPDSSGWSGQGYFPRVKKIVIEGTYMDLLEGVARIIGIDPSSVDVARANVRTHCDNYSKKPVFG